MTGLVEHFYAILHCKDGLQINLVICVSHICTEPTALLSFHFFLDGLKPSLQYRSSMAMSNEQ
jgi:hypothetical protein